MSQTIEDAIVDLYDTYVREHGDDAGTKLVEVKHAIRGEVRDLIVGTERDVDAEADALISATLSSTRQKRSQSLKRQLDYLLDGFPEEGAFVDPLLDQAFRLGDETGVDKTLRNWTVEDLRNLTVTRYRNAADATKAAAELDSTVQRVVDRMIGTGSALVGAVPWVDEHEGVDLS